MKKKVIQDLDARDPLATLEPVSNEKTSTTQKKHKDRTLIQKSKIEKYLFLSVTKQKSLEKSLQALPGENECYHVVGSGKYDAFHYIPAIISLSGVIEELWITTWSIIRANIIELIRLHKTGKIKEINFLTSIFFRSRYPSECHFLITEMQRAKQRIRLTDNHSKIILARTAHHYITITNSANMTTNPRIEHACMFNSKEVFEWNKQWIAKLFKNADEEKN